MQIVFLGTGGYHPNERRHTAGVMLPELGVVFDAGTSFFRVQPRLQTRTLDVFLTHAHLDHIVGLTYFLIPMLQKQVRRVRVHGNRRTLAAVRKHLFSKPVFPVLPEFAFVELEGPVKLSGGARLTWQRLPSHPGGSTAFRIDWPAPRGSRGRSFAYVTDTTVDGSYTEFVRGVDILLHECNFPDELAEWGPKTGHSHTTPVAELARAADVGRLFLMHIDPQRPGDDPIGIATAQAIFPETRLAEDLDVIDSRER